MQEPNPELLKKAQRHQVILYVVMIVFAVLPLVLIWLKRRGAFN
jgi:hypothetical protein